MAAVVRTATVQDAEAIARVHVRSWQQAYAHVFPAEALAGLSVERRADSWRELLETSDALVAEDAEGVVGFANVGRSRDEDGVGELYAIYVDPAAWGDGHGRRLIEAGEALLRDRGFVEATLWVLEDNPRARCFYEAAGWALDGASQTIEPLGVQAVEVRYRKSLAST